PAYRYKFEAPYERKVFSHDYAPNPFHAWIFLFLLPIWYIWREKFTNEFKKTFLWGIIGFVLLSLVSVWHPWIARYQVTFWTWVSIWIAVTIDTFWQKETFIKKFTLLFLYLILTFKFFYYFFNSSTLALKENQITGKKTIWNTPKEELYFLARPHLYEPFKKLAEQIIQRKCSKIGLVIYRTDEWEYPLWKLLHNRGFYPQIKHIQIPPDNLTKSLEDKNFQPCMVVEIDSHKNIAKIKTK
ncbi:MAG: hypothetical protein RMJ97_09925, partial [Raineya sp.]|nr:hypothetical protein [Raineya sp.]